jgi:pimeloyl-ACP methyl ester carboxylesterase
MIRLLQTPPRDRQWSTPRTSVSLNPLGLRLSPKGDLCRELSTKVFLARFVLIPGAWLGAWAWKEVTPYLEKKGHSVYPVTLTGMGERIHLATNDVCMETAIQDVLNVIKYNDLDDFVLVGHSFAGKVAAAVADRAHEKLEKIIYVDAFRPENTREPQGGFDPTREFGPPPQGGNAILLTEEIIERIGKDVKDSNRKWMMSLATPWLIKLAKDPITLSKSYDVKKETYVFCSLSGDPVDEIITGKWGKLNGPYKVIEAGHWPMITKPEELAEDLVSLAK